MLTTWELRALDASFSKELTQNGGKDYCDEIKAIKHDKGKNQWARVSSGGNTRYHSIIHVPLPNIWERSTLEEKRVKLISGSKERLQRGDEQETSTSRGL